jgi:hypothetical protein
VRGLGSKTVPFFSVSIIQLLDTRYLDARQKYSDMFCP